MKINVGDYVRTNDGYINKVKKVYEWNILVDARDLFGEEINIPNNEIMKFSPSIIDLIEVGDYVNGELVQYIIKHEDEVFIKTGFEDYSEDEIKLIVTKEQFEAMQYVVKED